MQCMRMAAAAAALTLPFALLAPPAEAGHRHGHAVVAGAAGFALGTLFGSAVAAPRYYAPAPVYVAPPVVYQPAPIYYAPPPWTPDWYAYCGQRFASFDARTGTYLGHDGYRHMCR